MYNVKCKEYMQAAADGCQSLLCFKDRFMPVFFYALNQEKYLCMSYYVGRFFKEISKRGFKNCFYLSLLMRGFLLFASKCRIVSGDFLRNFQERGLENGCFFWLLMRGVFINEFFKGEGFVHLWLISLS